MQRQTRDGRQSGYVVVAGFGPLGLVAGAGPPRAGVSSALMALRSLILIAAALGAPSPAPGVASDDAPTIAEKVGTLADDGQHASAAKLAAEGAARMDLDSADRVILGGLAGQNFELSYRTGGPLTELCGLAAVMRLVAPLDSVAGRELKLAAATDAEKKLEEAVGSGWRAACVGPQPEQVANSEPAAPVTTTTSVPSTTPVASAVNDGRAVRADGVRWSRRLRAGTGLLAAGVVLIAPMAAVLAVRAQDERDLWAIHAASVGGMATDMQTEQAASLRHRYQVTTASAAALGATGAALAVTGVVLLATKGRRSKVAVAPWGARGVGGLVLEARF